MRNIVNLLKNKIGVTLFDKVRKKRVILIEVTKNDITCQCKDSKQIIHYTPNGTLDGFPDGMQILVPSRDMSDWDKFAWKKGDVLISNVGFKVLFDNWATDTYRGFSAKTVDLGDSVWCDTGEYTLASERDSKSFIAEIEKNLGGKLDLETLTIKKQLEFKDGDIVALDKNTFYAKTILILESFDKDISRIHVFLNCENHSVCYARTFANTGNRLMRLATESEKQELYTALEKQGKYWDEEKRAIVNLPKMYDLKPLDYFLARYKFNVNSSWNLSQYAYEDPEGEGYLCLVNGKMMKRCDYDVLPYNDHTKHLLGTTKEYKG